MSQKADEDELEEERIMQAAMERAKDPARAASFEASESAFFAQLEQDVAEGRRCQYCYQDLTTDTPAHVFCNNMCKA